MSSECEYLQMAGYDNNDLLALKAPAGLDIQAKLLDAAGQDISPWFRLEPFQNTYDTAAQLNYFNCFDRILDFIQR